MTNDEQKHMPTPSEEGVTKIAYTETIGGSVLASIRSPDGDEFVCTAPHGVSLDDLQAHTQRLLECWNACADMRDPAAEIARLRSEAENGHRLYALELQARHNAEAERDRLREANAELMQSLKNILPMAQNDDFGGPDVGIILDAARVLIAKHSAHGQEKGG